MQFNSYKPQHEMAVYADGSRAYFNAADFYPKRIAEREAIFDRCMRISSGSSQEQRIMAELLYFETLTEQSWVQARRPFYNVWPLALPHLLTLDLGVVTCGMIKPPLQYLAVRLPENSDVITSNGERVHSMLVGYQPKSGEGRAKASALFMTIQSTLMIDGEEKTFNQAKIMSLYPEDMTIKDCMARALDVTQAGMVNASLELMMKALQLYITLCFLADDPKLIEREVLAADRDKFLLTREQRFVDKAERRGVIGWNVGRQMTVAPHLRRAHMHGYWHGPGKSLYKIILLESTIVHRELLESVPSGHEQ